MRKECHKTKKKQITPSSSTMWQTKIEKELQKKYPEQNKKHDGVPWNEQRNNQ